MDRQIVYAGSIPLDTDLLSIQRNVQASIGALARAVLGDDPLVDGMACVPGATPYSVSVGVGSYTVSLPADYSAFGGLPADPTPVVRTGLLVADTVVVLGPPANVDHVVTWLVQATVTDVDAGPIALPYWNAGNPSIPYSGPGNTGQAQNTQRLLRVVLSVKSSGEQPLPGVSPSPDTGQAGLYSVTTYSNKPRIDASDIVVYPDSPRLRFRLPVLPPGFSQQEVHGSSFLWHAPDSVRRVRVRLVGGGGGGGGGDSTYSGGGGGAGGYAEGLVGVEPRQTYLITIGGGGAGGSPLVSGATGGSTFFGNNLVAATGGAGGNSFNPNCSGGEPGTGTQGTVRQPGGFGGDGTPLAVIPAGTGGCSAFGGGGRGSDQGGGPANGQASGSGGGGGYGVTASGGPGAPGVVIIEY